MARSIQQLFQDKVDWKDVGNVAKRRALRAMYDQNYQQQVAQATALNPSGLPMGTTPGQYTVTSSDTLSTIANANGTTETDLLNANPDVKQLQTGMVINTPRDSRFSLKNANTGGGGIGVPSAGPIGGVQGGLSPTFNQGMQALSDARSQQSRAIPQRFTNPSTGFTNFGNPFSQSQYTPSVNPVPYQGSIASTAMAIGGNYGLLGQPPTSPTGPATQANTPPRKTNFAPRENLVTLLDSITGQTGPNGRMPTPLELKLLENSGRIVPAGGGASGLGGNYSYSNIRRRGGGRGGGGGGGAARIPAQRGGVGQGERLPAFSSGSQFRGLINWRIG